MSASPLSVNYTNTNTAGVIKWQITNNSDYPQYAVLVRGSSCSPYYVFGNAYWQNYVRKVGFQSGQANSVGIGMVISSQNLKHHMALVFYIQPNTTFAIEEEVFNCAITGYNAYPVSYVDTVTMKIGYDPKIAIQYPLPAYLPNPRTFSIPVFNAGNAYLGQLVSPVYLDDYAKITNLLFSGTAVGIALKGVTKKMNV